jgi:regulatory protein
MAESGLQRTVPSRPTRQSLLSGSDAVAQAALRYLARRDRSEAHMKAYLSKLGASPVRIRTVLSTLRALGYLDDQAFARRWARDRMARKPMGQLRLEAELQAQGLDERAIAHTIEAIYGETGERHLALQLMHDRSVTPAYLRRRGFSEDTIEAVFSEMTIEPSPFSAQPSARKGKLRADS